MRKTLTEDQLIKELNKAIRKFKSQSIAAAK